MKANNDLKISFTLFSDAKFDDGMITGTNSVSIVLKTPIKNAKTLIN
ncbi:MAG: hypothetical protein WCK78_19225 [Paludibacter sp.]